MVCEISIFEIQMYQIDKNGKSLYWLFFSHFLPKTGLNSKEKNPGKYNCLAKMQIFFCYLADTAYSRPGWAASTGNTSRSSCRILHFILNNFRL